MIVKKYIEINSGYNFSDLSPLLKFTKIPILIYECFVFYKMNFLVKLNEKYSWKILEDKVKYTAEIMDNNITLKYKDVIRGVEQDLAFNQTK